MAETVAPVPFATRNTILRPLTTSFIEEMYELAVMGSVPWQWHGGGMTPDAFRESLWSGVLAQFEIVNRRSGASIGLLRAYDASLYHGYTSVTMILMPDYRLRVWPLEAALLFANYLFIQFNLRNLYAESAEPYFGQFRSGAGSAFEVEGHLRGRYILNGGEQDLYILRISRERWVERGVPLLERCSPEVVTTSAASAWPTRLA